MEVLTFNVDKDRRNLTNDVQNFDIDFKNSPSWVQARQYENQMRQVQVNVQHGDGTPFDLTGVNPVLEGFMPDGVHRIIDAKHGVMIDPVNGQFRFDFPAPVFAVSGSYKQIFFRLYRAGKNIATLEFSMEVLADKVISGLIPADYVTPIEDIMDKAETVFNNAAGDIDAIKKAWAAKLQDLFDSLSKTGKDTADALMQVQAGLTTLETQIKSDGLMTQADLDGLDGKLDKFNKQIEDELNAIDVHGRATSVEVQDARTNSSSKTYPTLKARMDNQENDLNNSINAKLATMRLTPEVFANEAALQAEYPQGNDQLNVTVDTGHLWIWYDGAWKDCGQYQTANILQDQIDLIKQQILDTDNMIVNSLAINTALGNKPFSAIGNVKLELIKGRGVKVTNNDDVPTQKGVTISVANSVQVYYFDKTLTLCARNNDSSTHVFVIDYVAVKTDGMRLALRSPLTKFKIPPTNEVNVISTVPRMDRLSTVAYNDIDHLEFMIYSQSDSTCEMEITLAKLSKKQFLPDINNAEKKDIDNLIDVNSVYSDTLNSEKVYVQGLNKTCQRFYTTTGKGAWLGVNFPMQSNSMFIQHIQDENLDRPFKGSITVKIPSDASTITKYFPRIYFYDTNGQSYEYYINNNNARLSGNTLKYVFTVPSINNVAPNISFDHLQLSILAHDLANFDVTIIDASLKFNEESTVVLTRQNDDLGVNIMKALNDGDSTFVSTSGAIKCQIIQAEHRNAFSITKDSSSNTGAMSIILPDFAGSEGDRWVNKRLDLFVEVISEIKVTLPMQLTYHLVDGTTVPIPLNPLFLFHTRISQIRHAQIIPALYAKTDVIPDYVTLDISVNDPSTWRFLLRDISFTTCDADGTQDMNYLPDKSAKLPQLKLFGDLDKLTSKNDKIVVPCSFVNHEQLINGYAQLKWQGDSTLGWPKKSYTVTLFSDPEATVELNFKPMPNFYLSNKFTAKADYIDRFHVRNGYGAWLFKEILQTRQALPDFFKTMNNFGEIQIMPINIVYYGINKGIYTLQTKKSNALYGMDKKNPNDIVIQGIGNSAGAMWNSDTVTFDPDGNVGDFELITDSDEKQNVQTAINRLAAFINSSTDDDFAANLNNYIDLDSLADLIISIQLTQNYDSAGGKNTTYITHDGLKWYVQAYDMDSTLGTSWQPGSTQDDNTDIMNITGNRLFRRFKQLFKDYLKNRFNDVDNSGVIAPFRMQEKFKSMVDSIGEYNFEQDNAVWPNQSYDGKDLSYILWLINYRYYFTKNWINNL